MFLRIKAQPTLESLLRTAIQSKKLIEDVEGWPLGVFVFTGICPMAWQNAHADANDSSLVFSPGDISTSFMS